MEPKGCGTGNQRENEGAWALGLGNEGVPYCWLQIAQTSTGHGRQLDGRGGWVGGLEGNSPIVMQ